MNLMRELDHLANRGYTEGFYRRHVPSEYQNYDQNSVPSQQQFVGDVTPGANGYAREGWLDIDAKNRFSTGDQLELITPQGNLSFTLEAIENKRGQRIDTVPGSGHVVRIAVPEQLQLSDEHAQHAMLMRHL